MSTNKNENSSLYNKIDAFSKNPLVIIICNICSILSLMISLFVGNQWLTIISTLLVLIFTLFGIAYFIHRYFAIKKAKINIEKTQLARNKEIGKLMHKFFKYLRDYNSYLYNNVNVKREEFYAKAQVLCDQIEKIFTKILDSEISVCIKLIDVECLCDNDINNWEVHTFVRSTSTAEERYRNDVKSDRIVENTDFEIILRNVGRIKQKEYFFTGNLEKYISEFYEQSGEKFNNSHEDYKYRSTIVVPIKICCNNMCQVLKEWSNKSKDDKSYHVLGFLCIDSEDIFEDKKSSLDFSKFISSIEYACAMGDSLYHFFESYIVNELS